MKLPLPERLKSGLKPGSGDTGENIKGISDHLIIIGYGVNGKNVSRAAKYANIPYVIIELNPQTVRAEKSKGEPMFYGDASQEVVLQHANTEKALILVVTLPNSADIRRITQVARRLNPHLHIIIRTRFVEEMKDLYKLGADEVIPEEFETSIEIFTRVLAKFLVPHEEIEKLVANVRSDGYEMFRSLSLDKQHFSGLKIAIPEVNIGSMHVCSNATVIGKSLLEIGFAKNYKISLLAISRGQQTISNPKNDLLLMENDILFFLGSNEKILEVTPLFRPGDGECVVGED